MNDTAMKYVSRPVFFSVNLFLLAFGIFFAQEIIFANGAQAAACCGGGAAFPTLITGDFKSQVSVSSAYGHVVGDVDADGGVVFRSDSHLQDIQTYKLEGSYQISEDVQLGISLPFVSSYSSNAQISEQANAVGDVMAVAAYEFMPMREYSEWKPRGFIYFKVGIPTGVSPYDATSALFTDVNGTGFYSTAMGALFIKNKGNWDFEASVEIADYFARDFNAPVGAISVVPGPSVAGFVSAGYSPSHLSDWRAGLSVAPHLFAAKQITGAENSEASSELYWDASVTLSFMPVTEWMIAASYTDQTLIGPVQNTSLGRTAGVLFQHRWNL